MTINGGTDSSGYFKALKYYEFLKFPIFPRQYSSGGIAFFLFYFYLRTSRPGRRRRGGRAHISTFSFNFESEENKVNKKGNGTIDANPRIRDI
ncbi:MAG: hypothetical protein P9M08_10340 [Candidatus Erginobacter occultus]|nr:hypothetical protein [Candidatus Erginobacter occultus]